MHLFVVFLLTFLFSLHVEARPLTFSPAPLSDTQTAFEEFSLMINYLEKKLGEKIDFHYEEKYDDMITSFKENKIDLAYFGPLPLATLQKSFSSALPLLAFNEPDGKSGYRCVLVQFAKDKIDFQKSDNIKVALTQPLSTCGYMQTKILLKTYVNKDIEKMKFGYLGTHDEVALSIIRGDFEIGGMKESIANEYQSLGLKVLKTSQMLPSFTLVVNTNTLSHDEIANIQKILLEAPKEVYKTWGKSISFGFGEVDLKSLDTLNADKLQYDIPQKGNF